MFGTFRFNDSLNEAEYVELSRDSGVDARGYTLVACKLCRARKLKCSGDRGGCSRCLASSAECTYGPDGDGYRNSITVGRSKLTGAAKQRRRQTAGPPSSSSTSQQGRISIDVHVAPRRSRDAENGDARRQDANDWSTDVRRTSTSVAPDSAKSTPARPGSSSDAPHSNTDWSSDWFDFNDFSDLNGDTPTFGLSSPILPADGTPANAVISTIAAGALPAICHPPNPPARAPSTPSASAAASVPVGRSSLTAPGGCQCLTTLAAVLERLGRYRLGDKPKTANNLDCLLFCLGSGVGACNKILSCKTCDACQDHSILLATIAEQLSHVCNDLCGCLLAHQHKVRSAANTETPSASASTLPGDPSSGNLQQPEVEAEADALVDGDISFGRYHIQGVEMRLRLIKNLMALHMTDLLALLDQLSQRIGQVDGATGMLTDARKTAYTAHWMLQRLQSE